MIAVGVDFRPEDRCGKENGCLNETWEEHARGEFNSESNQRTPRESPFGSIGGREPKVVLRGGDSAEAGRRY